MDIRPEYPIVGMGLIDNEALEAGSEVLIFPFGEQAEVSLVKRCDADACCADVSLCSCASIVRSKVEPWPTPCQMVQLMASLPTLIVPPYAVLLSTRIGKRLLVRQTDQPLA